MASKLSPKAERELKQKLARLTKLFAEDNKHSLEYQRREADKRMAKFMGRQPNVFTL